MSDPFLEVDGVKTEEEAVRWSINAAVQQRAGGRVYSNDQNRTQFRKEWARLILEEFQPYRQPAQAISDAQHCEAIQRISDTLSLKFGALLVNGRLRYGTSQKAFNLYLKYLWRMGKAARPPHCPIDGIVLGNAGIDGSWTKSDSEKEYMNWIDEIRKRAAPRSLADWEYEIWLRWRQAADKRSQNGAGCG